MLIFLLSACGVGVLHTLFGPDHYVPFVVLAKARSWSMWRTATITLLCGVGHILGAVLVGILVIGLGLAAGNIEWLETMRGTVAAWLLISCGMIYGVWGVRQAARKSTYCQIEGKNVELMPWVLFIIFVLDPCEPLIPFMLYPPFKQSLWQTIAAIAVFGVSTLITMLGMVLGSVYGMQYIKAPKLLQRYSHAVAGMVICSCGLAIRFLGI